MSYSDNEIKHAVALFYDGEEAPKICAKGQGLEAEEILRIAKEHDIPLCDNPPLVSLLSQLELGDEIPQSLYIATATIIAFAYKMRVNVLDQDTDSDPETIFTHKPWAVLLLLIKPC